jgi:hypothetical protein
MGGRQPMSPDGPRDKKMGIDMTQAFFDEVGEFLREHGGMRLASRNTLAEVALRYYMTNYKIADGLLDKNGYPVIK